MKDYASWVAMTDEERAKALEAKRRRARARMRALEIKPITEKDRPYASAVEPAPSLQKRAHVEVVSIESKRKKA